MGKFFTSTQLFIHPNVLWDKGFRMKASEFLGIIRSELNTRGWSQTAMKDKDGQVCLTGAMREACQHIQLHKIRHGRKLSPAIWAEYTDCDQAAYRATCLLHDVAHEMGADSIVEVNDLMCSTKRDAMAFVEKAIGKAQESGD